MLIPFLTPKFRLPRPLALALLAVGCLALSSQSSRAAMMPYADVKEMCMMADVVVAGSYEGEDKLRISKVLWPMDSALKPGELIKVPALATHTRKEFKMTGRNSDDPEIDTKKMVLFAKHNKQGVADPIWNFGSGSQGVIWHSEKRSYQYQQFMNPGSYVLRENLTHPDGLAIGKEKLWEEIKSGLERRKRREDVKAIKDPQRRARAMASVYLKATTPRGGFEGLKFNEELEGLGVIAISAITEVLVHIQPDEPVDELASIVVDIARNLDEPQRLQALKPVVVPLVSWLRTSKNSRPGKAIWVLYLAQDATGAEVTRRFLKKSDGKGRWVAIHALGAMKDEASFESLAELLKTSVEVGYSEYNLALSRALYQINPKLADPIVEEVAGRKGNEQLRALLQARFPNLKGS